MVARHIGWMVLGLLGFGTTAMADHAYSIHQIAVEADNMQDDLRELSHELRHHYRDSVHYGELQAQTRKEFSETTTLVLMARAGRDIHGMHVMIDRLVQTHHGLMRMLKHADQDWYEHHDGHRHGRHNAELRIPHVRELVAELDHHIHDIHDEIEKIHTPGRYTRSPGYGSGYVPGYNSGYGPSYGIPQTYGRPNYDSRSFAPTVPPTSGFVPYSPQDSGYSFNAGRLSFQFGR